MTPISLSEAAKRPTSLDNGGFSVETHKSMSPSQRLFWGESLYEKQLLDEVVRRWEPKKSRARKIRSCSSHILVLHNLRTDKLRLGTNACEHRMCPRCSKALRMELALRVEKWVGKPKAKTLRFITLTLKATNEPLKEQLTHLQASFRRLRQTTLWKNSQTKGKAFIEVTWNAQTHQWHPHLHILSFGRFILQHRLADVWQQCSGGSRIVDVRMIHTSTKASRYVSKYVGKAPNLTEEKLALDLTREYYEATRDRKMILSFGDAGPLPELTDDDDPDPLYRSWLVIGTLEAFQKYAAAGSAFHQHILRRLSDQTTLKSPP